MIRTSDHSVAGQNVSRETWDRLETLAAKVKRWNVAINLVSPQTLPEIWTRHIEDSAQVFGFCPPRARHWADLGSGGGFPGLVVAALARDTCPDLHVTLVEADQRKATFLRTAARELDLSVTIVARRIEGVPDLAADVISARALAPLETLLGLMQRHLKPGGIAILPKGARYAEEIETARRSWDFDVDSHPSLSNPDAAILIIRKFNRARQS